MEGLIMAKKKSNKKSAGKAGRGASARSSKRAAGKPEAAGQKKPAQRGGLEKKVASAPKEKPRKDTVVARLKGAVAYIEAEHGQIDHFWLYVTGARTTIGRDDRKKLGYFADAAKLIVSSVKNEGGLRYLREHYVDGVKEEGKKGKVYREEVSDDDRKEMGSVAPVAELIVDLRKKAKQYDEQKKAEAEAQKLYAERRQTLMEKPYEVISAEGRDVGALVSDAVKDEAEAEALVQGMEKDPAVVFRAAATSKQVRRVLVDYTRKDGKDTPLTAELEGMLDSARDAVEMTAVYERLEAAMKYKPSAAAGNGNGNGNGNGGKPKKK
jgi:hypothetical protein